MGKWKKAVKCFEWVRDIPYMLPLSVNEPDYCCDGKHNILYHALQGLGVDVRPMVCKTRWSDLKQIPWNILTIPHDDKILHLYLQFRGGKEKGWRNLDASLDGGLSSVFPVNQWDGKSETEICVKPRKIYSARESMGWFRENGDWEADLKRNYDFYVAMNKWFDSLRQE